MIDHGARDHAKWSASATSRNWNCAGALAMAELVTTPERENPASAWGTACHQVSEKCLRSGKDAAEFIGTIETTKQHKIEVDDELANTAQEYIDFVRSQAATGTTLQIEQKFSLASLNPPFEAGGTADAVVYDADEKLMHVIDLKGGRGVVVEAKGNPQLRTYALGAMLANPGLDVASVKVTIVQPRAPHKDGRIRSETFHVVDLMEWTADLLAAMRRSAQALADAEAVARGEMIRSMWNRENLRPGDHCKFCPAAGFCPALEQRALDAVGVWFDDQDQPQISNAPSTMTPEKLSATLDLLDMIGEWANSVRAYAHDQAESGVTIPNYQLAEKIGNRRWKGDEDKVREALFLTADLAAAEVENRKLKSPAQIEKVLGAKRKHLIDDLVERPVTGTNLVRVTNTTRPAATPSVNRHFSPIED